MMHSPSTPQNLESAPLYTFTWFVIIFCAHIQFFFLILFTHYSGFN